MPEMTTQHRTAPAAAHEPAAQPDRRWNQIQRVTLVGTYVPRRCGIATFTADLAEAMAQAAPALDVWVAAMNDRPQGYTYPHRVKFELNEPRRADYRLAADFLNMGRSDVVCIQHEYGIYGGDDGAMVLDLVRRVRMPVVVTLHTILRDPSPSQHAILRQLAESADRLVTLSRRGAVFLRDIYGLNESQYTFIPHGIHDVPFVDPNYYKDQFGVEGKKVILTFGLLSPNKGIEGMIDALPRIVERHPDAVYIVLGATHPGIVARHGEDYRASLLRRAEDRGVGDRIFWHNKFVETDELMEFLGAADVYVTPYLNEAQIVSGTLAYALGAGKATVSTPYWYAEEMLEAGRGKLVPFQDPDALADAVCGMFDREVDRHAMRKRAYQFTRQMRWSDVAGSYLDLFTRVVKERQTNPKPVVRRERLHAGAPDLPEIKLTHLDVLTDDVGVIHEAGCSVPRRDSGYRTADQATALIAVQQASEHVATTDLARLNVLASRCLSFLAHAFDPDAGRFRAHLGYDRAWAAHEPGDPSAQRCTGAAVWGLGVVVARSQVRGHHRLAAELFQRALPGLADLTEPLAVAEALLGMHAYLRQFSGDAETKRVRDALAMQMFDRWRAGEREDWRWFADSIGEGYGRIVQAMLLSGRWTFRRDMLELALRSLAWLIEQDVSADQTFAPIGMPGGWTRGQPRARFEQRPGEVAGLIDACLEARRITDDAVWLRRAHGCFSWFFGENDLRQPVYDPRTGACYDGLGAQDLNPNQGAGSTIAWLMSLMSLYDEVLDVKTDIVVDGADKADRATDPPPESKSDPGTSPGSTTAPGTAPGTTPGTDPGSNPPGSDRSATPTASGDAAER